MINIRIFCAAHPETRLTVEERIELPADLSGNVGLDLMVSPCPECIHKAKEEASEPPRL